jgi:hypothetical protein
MVSDGVNDEASGVEWSCAELLNKPSALPLHCHSDDVIDPMLLNECCAKAMQELCESYARAVRPKG